MDLADLLNSPLVSTLVISGIVWLYHKATDGSARRRRAVDLMVEVWDAAEALGLTQKLDGPAKWRKFAGMFFDAVRAEMGREPTPQEMEAARLYAERRAMAEKLRAGAPRVQPQPQ